MVRAKTKQSYSSPETKVFGIRMENGILNASGNDAGLSGAGVDESDADDNGGIW